MKISTTHAVLALIFGVSLLATTRSYGIPAFARRYQMECTMCHEPVPRLNEFGYKFRAAGFRRPEEIGKGTPDDDYSHYIAARVQLSGTYTSTAGSNNNTSVNAAAQTNLNIDEAAIYPLCGAFGGNISAWSEFDYDPGMPISMMQAFARFTYGDTASFWSVRAGLFNPIEGYGASDEPLGVSGPLFLEDGEALTWMPGESGTTLASSLYTPGATETGVDIGWNLDRFSVHAGIYNGGYDMNNAYQAAIGGGLSKPANSPSYNSKDIGLFANYILDEHGGGISGYFFTGKIDFPNPVNTSPAAMFPDAFMRYGILAGTPTFSGFKVYAGLGLGTDNVWQADSTLPKGGKVADSTMGDMGYFGELDYRLDKNWYFGTRYDYFDPTTGANYQNDQVNALSVFTNYCMNNGLTVIADASIRTTNEGADATNTPLKQNDYDLTLSAFYIW